MRGRKPIPDSHGRLNRFTVTSPAAGVEVSEVVPANRRWEVLSVALTFTTDATVATRRVHLLFRPAGQTVYRIPSNATQVASLTVQNFFLPSVRDQAAAINLINVQPLPFPVILPEGSLIETATENLQVGDDYVAGFIYVQEWIEQIA